MYACLFPTNRLHPDQLERDKMRVLVLFVPVLNVDLYGWCEHTLCVPTGNAGSALLLVAHGGMKL